MGRLKIAAADERLVGRTREVQEHPNCATVQDKESTGRRDKPTPRGCRTLCIHEWVRRCLTRRESWNCTSLCTSEWTFCSGMWPLFRMISHASQSQDLAIPQF